MAVYERVQAEVVAAVAKQKDEPDAKVVTCRVSDKEEFRMRYPGGAASSVPGNNGGGSLSVDEQYTLYQEAWAGMVKHYAWSRESRGGPTEAARCVRNKRAEKASRWCTRTRIADFAASCDDTADYQFTVVSCVCGRAELEAFKTLGSALEQVLATLDTELRCTCLPVCLFACLLACLRAGSALLPIMIAVCREQPRPSLPVKGARRFARGLLRRLPTVAWPHYPVLPCKSSPPWTCRRRDRVCVPSFDTTGARGSGRRGRIRRLPCRSRRSRLCVRTDARCSCWLRRTSL